MQARPAYLLKPSYKRVVGSWLLVCLILIGLMVALGGYTRLSGSGLSITEWKPIHGTIPPQGSEQWQEEFEKYKAIPQYEQVNKGMTLEEFKAIYWPEFWHRNLGRLIGLVYALPFFFFMSMGVFTRRFSVRLFGILLLGGLQGLIGWIMVASGLQDRLYVDHLKLTIHFGTAMLLTSAVAWTWLDVVSKPHPSASAPLVKASYAVPAFALITLLIFCQLLVGALVAGLHAGYIYNYFPTMDGELWITPDVFSFAGSWFDYVPMVQFVHRWLAKTIVVLSLAWLVCYIRQILLEPKLWLPLLLFVMMLGVQFTLGVLTLINVVPLDYALMHQIGGFLLLILALKLLHSLHSGNNPSVQ